MNFWQKYKKKIIQKLRVMAPTSLLFIYLAYPKTTLAFLPAIGWLGYTLAGSAVVAIANLLGFSPVSWAGDQVAKSIAFFASSLSMALMVASKGIFNFTVWGLNGLIELSLSSSATINMTVITQMWSLIRDFANLSLIFILLYISISTVLGLNGSNTYKMLGKLILVGLLMNFSLVFTNVIIDASNIVALQFVHIIEGDNDDVGTSLALALSIPNLISEDPVASDEYKTYMNTIITMLGLSAFLLTASFTVGVGAVMFLVRIIKLMVVMIFAPLAFVAAILPKTQRYTEEWWGQLTGNAFLAPVYLFMIYVSLSLIAVMFPPQDITRAGLIAKVVGVELTSTQAEEKPLVKTITNMALAMVLITMSGAVAAKMSGETATQGKKLAGLAFGTGVGAVATAGRRYGGQAGQAIYEKYASDNSTTGKILRGTGDIMRKGTWDVRNAPVAGAGIELAGAQAGMKTSEGLVFKDAKASAGGRLKQETDKEAKVEAEEKERKDTVRRLETDKIKADLGDVSKIEGSIAGYGAETDPEKKKAMLDKAIQEKMKKLNPEELLKLIGDDVSDPKKKHLVENLSDKRAIKSLEEKLTDEDKVKLQTLITDNKKNNEPGAKHYTENIKKEAEQKMANDLKNYLSGITVATPDNEISNKIISVSPNIVLNPEVRKIIMQDDAVGLKIRANLKGRALDKLISDAIKGGETSVDDLLKIERNIKMNPSNTAGKKTFDSKRVKELLGRV